MKSAARYVSSVIQQSGDNANDELHILAMLTIYHSNIAWEDIAELVYSTSEVLQITKKEETTKISSSSCSLSIIDDMMTCPPHTVQVGDKTYPPSSIVDAAQKRCEQRENSTERMDDSGVCTESDTGGEESFEFPTTISDGYLNYHPPKSRGPEDVLVSVFSALDAIYEPPSNIVELKQREEDLRSKKSSLSKTIADMQNELGHNDIDRARKYGVNGELYAIRDTCYKLEYGQYEYEVCIFGKATQRDIGQNSGGGTNLGSWQGVYMDEKMGQRTLKWEGGTKCWNGPNRSAEVTVTCGADTKLLTADEPETCKYAFTMESPIGCDETFKTNNSL
jgi:protein kinase C substrate 80K-H